jgi:hypothetical protein
MACSLWTRPWSASASAFSAFFALATADLADFSPATLAAVAVSQAFLEALRFAYRDAMWAFTAVKASAVRNRERKGE